MAHVLADLDERVSAYNAAKRSIGRLMGMLDRRRLREVRYWAMYWSEHNLERRMRLLRLHERALRGYYRAKYELNELALYLARQAASTGGLQ